MKIVVFGSNGFIGSHICEQLKKSNFSVIEVDTLKTHGKEERSYIQIADFLQNYENYQSDIWINAAGNGDVQKSILDPKQDYLLNTKLVYDILELKKKISPKGVFIHLSSAAVYGNPIRLPIKENDQINPITPYGEHKVLAENLCYKFANEYGIKSIILRPFSVYGQRQEKLFLWDLFTKLASELSIIELFGTGNESRDFLSVHDLSQLICILVKNHYTILEDFLVLNAASGRETKINEIVDFVKPLFPNKEITFSGNTRKGDPLNWRADISEARKLGFEPQVSLFEGILNYYTWHKNLK